MSRLGSPCRIWCSRRGRAGYSLGCAARSEGQEQGRIVLYTSSSSGILPWTLASDAARLDYVLMNTLWIWRCCIPFRHVGHFFCSSSSQQWQHQPFSRMHA